MGGVWEVCTVSLVLIMQQLLINIDKTTTENSWPKGHTLLAKIVYFLMLTEHLLHHAFLPCVFSTHKIACIYSCNDHTNKAFHRCVFACVSWDAQPLWKNSRTDHMNMAFHHCALACDFWDSEPLSKNTRTGQIYMAFHILGPASEFFWTFITLEPEVLQRWDAS